MTEDTQGQNTNPVAVTQDPAMPTGEQKAPEQSRVDQGAVQTAEVSPQQSQSEGLPEGTSERTRREFEKLREELRQERAKKAYTENVFQSMAVPPVKPPEPVLDPYTGMVDERLTAMQQQAYEANQRAIRAEQAVTNFYQEQQNREAYATHPELDPNSKSFDRNLHIATRRILMDSMVNPGDYGNKQLSFKEAADLAKGVPQKVLDQAKKEGATQAIEQLTPKEQAALEAAGNPGRREEVSDQLPNLQHRSRRGDLDAIVERLRAIPPVGK